MSIESFLLWSLAVCGIGFVWAVAAFVIVYWANELINRIKGK